MRRLPSLFTLAAGITSLLTSTEVLADANDVAKAKAPLVEGSLSLLIGFGGDELASVTSTAGTYALNAGDGSGVALGLAVLPYRTGKHAVGVALELGYLRGSVEAGNGSLDSRRVPMSALAQFHWQTSRSIRWQFGLGPVYHGAIELEGNEDGLSSRLALASSIGVRGAVGFQWFSTPTYGLEIDLYHESIKHRHSELDSDIDASSTGMSARFLFNVL